MCPTHLSGACRVCAFSSKPLLRRRWHCQNSVWHTLAKAFLNEFNSRPVTVTSFRFQNGQSEGKSETQKFCCQSASGHQGHKVDPTAQTEWRLGIFSKAFDNYEPKMVSHISKSLNQMNYLPRRSHFLFS